MGKSLVDPSVCTVRQASLINGLADHEDVLHTDTHEKKG